MLNGHKTDIVGAITAVLGVLGFMWPDVVSVAAPQDYVIAGLAMITGRDALRKVGK